MNHRNLERLFAMALIAAALAGCGGGGSASTDAPQVPVVPVVFTATRTAATACASGPALTGSGSGSTQAAADAAAQAAADAKVPAQCPAAVVTSVAVDCSKATSQACALTGLPAGVVVKAGSGTLTSGATTTAVAVAPSGAITWEGDRYFVPMGGAVTLSFTNAPAATVNVTFITPKYEVAAVKAPITPMGVAVTAEPVFSEIALSTKFDQQPWKDFVAGMTQAGVWFRSGAVVNGCTNVIMVAYRMAEAHFTAQFCGDTGEYVGPYDGYVGSSIGTTFQPTHRIGTANGLNTKFSEQGGVCVSYNWTPTGWLGTRLDSCAAF